MTELPFLSIEVENENETTEEDTELSNSKNIPRLNGDSQQVYSRMEDDGGRETVEICQQTVNPNNRVSSENFMIQRVIGKGGYGKVFLVQKVDGKDKGKLYAMKVLKKARLVCNEKDKAHTVSERNILQMLRHPFLVKLHYAFQNHSNLYIVLEYCPGGELFNYLEKEGALLENAACFYVAEIVLAIGHLHSLGIIYRDLKSENVLLDRQGHVKLTDFGLSKEGVGTTNTFCGTIEYMAPEIIRCEGHGKAVDWWSLGTLMYDMLSGAPPFSQEESKEATTQKILTAPLKFPPSFSVEVVSLIRGLLKRDPKERLGSKDDVEEVKRHKFFRRHDINWSDVLHRRLRPPFRPKLAAANDVSMFDPTFTRLQPIVSPAETNRPIPPDLFQGFSYVGPSVCEEVMREPWVDADAGTRRRQYRNQAALSTGRLRRMEPNPSHWSAKQQERRIAPDTPVLPVSQIIRETEGTRSLKPKVIAPSPTAAHSNVTHLDAENQLNYPTVTSDKEVIDVDTEHEEEIGEDEDENDEEVEEENVPGAKHIQGTYIPPTPSFPDRIGTQPTTLTISTKDNPPFPSTNHASTCAKSNQPRSKHVATLGPVNYRGIATGHYDKRAPVLNAGLPTATPKWTNPRQISPAGNRAPAATSSFTASTTSTASSTVSSQTSTASSSKCCMM